MFLHLFANNFQKVLFNKLTLQSKATWLKFKQFQILPFNNLKLTSFKQFSPSQSETRRSFRILFCFDENSPSIIIMTEKNRSIKARVCINIIFIYFFFLFNFPRIFPFNVNSLLYCVLKALFL